MVERFLKSEFAFFLFNFYHDVFQFFSLSVKCREGGFSEFRGQGGLFELETLRHGGILTIGIT